MAKESKLEQAGFTLADPDIRPRIIAAISGREKQGKTHFALTAPGDIALFDSDIGTEGVVHKFAGDKKVYTYEMSVPRNQNESEKAWEEFESAYYDTLRSKSIRTIIGDTATEWWELLRMARFGQLDQVMPYHYGPVNAEYRRIIKDAYKSDKNLILLHKMKPVYIDDKRTANYERSGFGDTGHLVQVNCEVWREKGSDEERPGDFHVYIADCRHNPDIAGEDLFGPLCDFPQMAAMMTDTSVGEWE